MAIPPSQRAPMPGAGSAVSAGASGGGFFSAVMDFATDFFSGAGDFLSDIGTNLMGGPEPDYSGMKPAGREAAKDAYNKRRTAAKEKLAGNITDFGAYVGDALANRNRVGGGRSSSSSSERERISMPGRLSIRSGAVAQGAATPASGPPRLAAPTPQVPMPAQMPNMPAAAGAGSPVPSIGQPTPVTAPGGPPMTTASAPAQDSLNQAMQRQRADETYTAQILAALEADLSPNSMVG